MEAKIESSNQCNNEKRQFQNNGPGPCDFGFHPQAHDYFDLRAPISQSVAASAANEVCVTPALKLIAACRENVGRIRVFSIKVALATMCAGKLMDKLRCELSAAR
jgi:hypothetical protein